jgi:hypothetical protein
MLWRKSEHSMSSHSKKIILERKIFGGNLHVRKYIEEDLPRPNGHPVGTIYCLTRRRPFWRFRLWTPLQSTYFTLNAQGRWVQVCRTLH